jgi:hypothetical protein
MCVFYFVRFVAFRIVQHRLADLEHIVVLNEQLGVVLILVVDGRLLLLEQSGLVRENCL